MKLIWRHLRNMKENDGRAARQSAVRVLVWFVAGQMVIVLIYLTTVQLEQGSSGGPRTMIRQYHGSKANNNNIINTLTAAKIMANPEHAVLEVKYFLIDLHVAQNALAGGDDDEEEEYHGVKGIFCPLDWHLQKSNPSGVPMFHDLVSQSTHCQSHRIELDIATVTRQARHHDAQQQHQHSSTAIKELQLAGFIFHETRCGSTLVANLLSAADPHAHRVYSEASPLLTALTICDDNDSSSSSCNIHKAQALVRDVLYLMGRSNDVREQRVFYKIQSVGVRNIHSLTQMLPEIPWIFVYRNSLEVMMSHFKDGKVGDKAVCLRRRRRQQQPPHALISDIAQRFHRDVSSLSNAEYCAVHLASLCEAAIREASTSSSSMGRFVNYADLPDILWNSIVPNHFHVQNIQLSNMQKVAGIYSKGRGEKANVEWAEDSTRKQAKGSDEIRIAARIFLDPSFDKLQELGGKTTTTGSKPIYTKYTM